MSSSSVFSNSIMNIAANTGFPHMNIRNYIQQVRAQEKFYGTAKLRKLPVNGKIDDQPIRPIVSDINTATYELAKHLSKVLSPLGESQHNIKSTKDFIWQIKKEPIPAGYEMVSFDVKSLFTNVPLGRTINIILNRIYDHKELKTQITRCEIKEMLTLCTKNGHFTYNKKIFVQTDGITAWTCISRYIHD